MRPGRRQRAAELALRRRMLRTRILEQRRDLAVSGALLERRLGWVDLAWRALGAVRAHPWAFALPLAGVAVLRPRWLLATTGLLRFAGRL